MIAIAPFLPKIAGGLAITTILAMSGCAIQTARVGAVKSDLRAEKQRTSYLSAKIVDIADVQKAQNQRIIDWAKDIETQSKGLADNADKAFESGRAAAMDAADRYILAHRVRTPKGSGSAIGTPAPAKDGSAGVPAELPADAVLVSEIDVRACTAAADYALRAHEWAMSVEK